MDTGRGPSSTLGVGGVTWKFVSISSLSIRAVNVECEEVRA
jgi:hypothetical protein